MKNAITMVIAEVEQGIQNWIDGVQISYIEAITLVRRVLYAGG